MPITTEIVTVSTAATLLASGAGRSQSDKATVIVKNASGAMFLGGLGVTTATGLPLATTESVSMDLGPGDSLYGIVAAATSTVAVLRTRQ